MGKRKGRLKGPMRRGVNQIRSPAPEDTAFLPRTPLAPVSMELNGITNPLVGCKFAKGDLRRLRGAGPVYPMHWPRQPTKVLKVGAGITRLFFCLPSLHFWHRLSPGIALALQLAQRPAARRLTARAAQYSLRGERLT